MIEVQSRTSCEDLIKEKDKEIERLNNIINKLEERLINDRLFFEDVYKKSHLSEEEFRKQCPYTIGSYDHSVEMLGKLQELKGSDKE